MNQKCRLVRKIMGITVVLLFIVVIGTNQSFGATSASYVLDTGNAAVAGLGPYAQVDLSLSGGDINVTVTGLNGWRLFGPSAGSAIFGFNAVAGLTITPVCSSCQITAVSGGHNMDGLGTYQYELVDGSIGGTGGYTSLTFTVSNALHNFTDVNAIYNVTPDSSPYQFAAQVGNQNGNGGATGFAAGGPAVPEPLSILTLGFAVLGLGLVRKRLS